MMALWTATMMGQMSQTVSNTGVQKVTSNVLMANVSRWVV